MHNHISDGSIGYQTNSSGFGKTFERQQIDGPFKIDNDTKDNLEKIGVSVESIGNDTAIYFDAQTANLKDMKEMWDKIIALIPDRGTPVPQNESQMAKEFRAQYAPKEESSEVSSLHAPSERESLSSEDVFGMDI